MRSRALCEVPRQKVRGAHHGICLYGKGLRTCPAQSLASLTRPAGGLVWLRPQKVSFTLFQFLLCPVLLHTEAVFLNHFYFLFSVSFPMTNILQNALASRTAAYAKAIRLFTGNVPKTLATVDDLKQLIRASGSIGSTYIEAEEAQNKREFIACMKLCRKEARECMFWLRQLDPSLPDDLKDECRTLGNEAYALLRIFTACIRTGTRQPPTGK